MCPSFITRKVAVFALTLTGSLLLAACGGGGGNAGPGPSGGGGPGASPSAPTGVLATPGDASVGVTWNAVSDATSYNVYMASQAGVTKTNFGSLPGGMQHINMTSPFTHTALTNGITYYFVVTAVNVDGEGPESIQVLATPGGVIIPPGAGVTRLPKTGQTRSVAPGDDGDTQVGAALPNPRFTDNGDETLTDNLTGLMWTKNGNLGAITRIVANMTLWYGMSWANANNFVAQMNRDRMYGYNDWRMPNINELESVHDFTGFRDTSALANMVGDHFWSSSIATTHHLPGYDDVFTANGISVHTTSSAPGNLHFLLPVRTTGRQGVIQLPSTSAASNDGVPWPDPRFIDNGDNSVTDRLTDLIWTKDANLILSRDPQFDADREGFTWEFDGDGWVTWNHTLEYVKKLNDEQYLGHSDWRLPNAIELESMLDRTRAPALPANHPFINMPEQVPARAYWSSTSIQYSNGSTEAWYVSFQAGEMDKGLTFATAFVWPVRSAPAPANP